MTKVFTLMNQKKMSKANPQDEDRNNIHKSRNQLNKKLEKQTNTKREREREY